MPKPVVAILDYWNIAATTKPAKPSVLGIKNSLAAFDMELQTLFLGGPTMLMTTNSNPHGISEMVDKTRKEFELLLTEGLKVGIPTKLLPPGGHTHLEYGIDGIIALSALYLSIPDHLGDHKSEAVVILSSDADFIDLHRFTEHGNLIVGGFFNSDTRKKYRSFGCPHISFGNEFTKIISGKNRETAKELFSYLPDQRQSNTKVPLEALQNSKTFAVVDPYSIFNSATRELGIARMPTADTLKELISFLGFEHPHCSYWTIPDLLVPENTHGESYDDYVKQVGGEQMAVAWKVADSERDKLHENLSSDDIQARTESKRAEQKPQIIAKQEPHWIFYRPERLLASRTCKRLLTGIVADLSLALTSKPPITCIVISTDPELDIALRSMRAASPADTFLDSIFMIYLQPPQYMEATARPYIQYQDWVEGKNQWKAFNSKRLALNYICLTDDILARFVDVSHQPYGASLRALASTGIRSNNQIEIKDRDPETGGFIVDIISSSDQTLLDSPRKFPLIRLIGVTANGSDIKTTPLVLSYNRDDTSIAPLLVPEGSNIPGSRTHDEGQISDASVIRRAGTQLTVDTNNDKIPDTNINLGLLTQRFSTGTKIRVEKHDGKYFFLEMIDEAAMSSDVERVCITGGDEGNWVATSLEPNDQRGEGRLRILPIQPPCALEIGSELLAFISHEGQNKEGKMIHEWLAISSDIRVNNKNF